MATKNNSSIYYEPNAAPEEVQKQQQMAKRKVTIRFATEADVREFTRKTGINLVRNKTNRINFPINNVLDIE